MIKKERKISGLLGNCALCTVISSPYGLSVYCKRFSFDSAYRCCEAVLSVERQDPEKTPSSSRLAALGEIALPWNECCSAINDRPSTVSSFRIEIEKILEDRREMSAINIVRRTKKCAAI